MRNIKFLISIILVGSLIFVSCDKGFEELNKNPNEPTSVPSGLLMTNMLAYLGNYTYSTFWGGDMGSCWAQHWGKVNYEDEERYKPRQSIISDYCWKGMYEDVIADAKSMEKLAIAEGEEINQGVALTIQAYAFSILTEMFGDIPFSEAGRGEEGIITPVYDSQEAVYTGLFAMLDKADSLLANGTGSMTASTDLVYGGNDAKWRKFANSLKFRLL